MDCDCLLILPQIIFVRPLKAYAGLSRLCASKQGTRVRLRMDRRRRPPVTFASLERSVTWMQKMSGKDKSKVANCRRTIQNKK